MILKDGKEVEYEYVPYPKMINVNGKQIVVANKEEHEKAVGNVLEKEESKEKNIVIDSSIIIQKEPVIVKDNIKLQIIDNKIVEKTVKLPKESKVIESKEKPIDKKKAKRKKKK